MAAPVDFMFKMLAQTHTPQYIKYPLLFKIEKEGRSFLLLGTNHHLKLKYFHPNVLAHIKSANFISTEHSQSKLKAKDLPKLLNIPYDENWVNTLSPAMKEKLGKYISLKDPIIMYMFIDHFEKISKGMDSELIKLFENQECNLDLEVLDNQPNKGFLDSLRALVEEYRTDFIKNYKEVYLKNKDYYLTLGHASEYDYMLTDALNSLAIHQDRMSREVNLSKEESEDEYMTSDFLEKNSLNQFEMPAEAIADCYTRNHAWLPKIESNAKVYENLIVVIGAAHLVDNEGILALLEKKGYEISRVDNDGRFSKKPILSRKLQME